MQRVVFDVGVVISALISPSGTPAIIVAHWVDGRFDLVVSPTWLAELDRVATRPKFAGRILPDDVRDLRALFLRQSVFTDDPPAESGLTPDPGDDYLVSLARCAGASWIVSGDRHLRAHAEFVPRVVTPRAFLDALPRPPG